MPLDKRPQPDPRTLCERGSLNRTLGKQTSTSSELRGVPLGFQPQETPIAPDVDATVNVVA